MNRRFFKRYKKTEDSKHKLESDTNNINKKSVEAEKPDKPGFVDLAKNLTKSLIEWQRAGRPVVTSEQWNKRLSICRDCRFWSEIKTTNVARCTKCGCSSGKLLLSTSKCPLNPPKWTSEL